MDPIADLLQDAHTGRELLLLVRYDGLLDGQATVDQQTTSALLRRLVRTAGRTVHLISGSASPPPAWVADSGVKWHSGDGGLASAEAGTVARHDGVQPAAEQAPPDASAQALLARVRASAPDARLVVIGCTPADERLFALVHAPDVTARVGSGATHADARLEDGETVRGLLGALT